MLDADPFLFFSDLLAALVVVVPVYFAVPWVALRQLLLGLLGCALIFWIAPRLLLFYVAFWLGAYLLQLLATQWRERRSSWVLTAFVIVVALAPMVAWKLFPEWFVTGFNVNFNQALDSMSPWLGTVDRVQNIIIPVGLSFATFRAVDQLVKVRLEIIEPLLPLEHFAWAFFPPVQIIGPVAEYTEIEPDLRRRTRWEPTDTVAGLLTVALGAVKVFGLAYLLRSGPDVFDLHTHDGSAGAYWLQLVMYAWYFYFNFSGYSDIAIGTARLLGFRLAPNFNNPYLKTNPQDFWNSWHMSLTRFAQRNVFVPLGGMRPRTQYRAIFATIMVIALWHGLTLSLVVFGCYHAAGLIGHRWWVARHPVPADRAFVRRLGANVALFVFFTLSLPLLHLDLGQLGPFYERLSPW